MRPKALHPTSIQLVYTGFILILLSFFILLSSFASLEPSKISRFVRSFNNAISIYHGGLALVAGGEAIDQAAATAAKQEAASRLFERIQNLANIYGLNDQVNLSLDRQDIILRLTDSVLFASGQAEIRQQAYALLDKLGAMIAETRYHVRIEGHTDNVPIQTALFPSNWELSTARAVAVLRYIIEQFDVPATQLAAVGFGQYHPLAPNTSETNRARNRRVEIVWHTGSKPSGS